MAADRTEMDELVEERPVPGALVRHRGARLVQHGVERSAPRLEVHGGAVWLRATDAGPGVLACHGATTVQVREGAAVLEVDGFEAVLVVVSGRAAVKGAAALPRSVPAGHAVTLNLDGGFGSPEPITAGELRADRFVVENLARDVLAEAASDVEADQGAEVGSGPVTAPEQTTADPAEAPPPPSNPAGTRVDGTPPAMADPATPVAVPATATVEASRPAAGDAGGTYDPAPLAVPRVEARGGGGDGPDAASAGPQPGRRSLIAVVIVLVILAAVLGAIVLTGDAVPSGSPGDATAAAEVGAAADTPPEATIHRCEAGPSGHVAQGVVSGGGEGVARYRVEVGLEDSEGMLFAEKATTVDARANSSVEVRWTVELALTPAERRPDAECRLVLVEAL